MGSKGTIAQRARPTPVFIRLLVLASSLLSGGCASFSTQVQQHTLAYNFAQEDITNQTFLVNALRARDGRPMHFTTLSKVTGKLTVSGGGELVVPFGENSGTSDSTNSLSPLLLLSSSPSFDVIPENKATFMRGITTPVTLELFSRYWHQGWPKDLLVHLLVRKIEVVPVDASGQEARSHPIRVFINSPDAPDEGRESCTRGFLIEDHFVDRNTASANTASAGRPAVPALRVTRGQTVATFDARAPQDINPNAVETDWCRYEMFKFLVDLYLPRLRLLEKASKQTLLRASAKELSVDDLAKLAEIAEKKTVSLERSGDDVIVKTLQHKSVAVCLVKDVALVPADTLAAEADLFCPPGKQDQLSVEANSFTFTQQAGKNDRSFRVTAHFRSAQGVVFYLGEILRAAHRGGRVVCVHSRSGWVKPCPEGEVPVFVAQESGEGGEVTVPYLDGKTYAIPRRNAGRSMTTLSLLTQIFALSREANELPATSTVNVIN